MAGEPQHEADDHGNYTAAVAILFQVMKGESPDWCEEEDYITLSGGSVLESAYAGNKLLMRGGRCNGCRMPRCCGCVE